MPQNLGSWWSQLLQYLPVDSKSNCLSVEFCEVAYANAFTEAEQIVSTHLSFKRKMVAAAVLRNYHVKEAEGHHVSPCDSIVLRMKYSLTFRVSNLL
ncbi:hypothetical protein WN944_009911 [Citrus x changshan-huyou]|uniref:Uncharacterized protein n=1 Tax=Citrus x changshan-huyou TaxID=2935761 RepID=A0AAP0QSG2_9ROSI